jgi:cytochrome b561
MLLKNSPDRWGGISIALHWITAIFVIGLCCVGLIMTNLPTGAFKMQVYGLHKSFGLTVLALTLFRLLWRLLSKVPETLANTPRWQRMAASATHSLLYLLLLFLPLSGWLYNSASGFPLKYFGLFKIPKLSGFDRHLKSLAGDAHETLFYVLALVLLIHALAALKHHYLDKDTTLSRMLPNSRKSNGAGHV